MERQRRALSYGRESERVGGWEGGREERGREREDTTTHHECVGVVLVGNESEREREREREKRDMGAVEV